MAESTGGGVVWGPVLRDGQLACGIVVYGPKGEFIGLDPGARRLLGLPAEKVPPLVIQQLASQTLADGVGVERRELALGLPEGATPRLRASTSFCRSANGNEALVLVLIQELPRVVEHEEQLWRLERLAGVGTVAASMAHEIRNALVAGKTFLDLLLEQNQNSEISSIVRRELERIDSISTRMLKFASPPAPVRKPVRLAEVLQHTLRLVKAQAQGKQIVIAEEFGADPDMVAGDASELEQAFFNLLLNGVEATPGGGTIRVSTRRLGAAVEPGMLHDAPSESKLLIAIEDSGAGIAAENLPRLFEPFFTTKSNGTGLGLAITKRIIEQHSGQLEVQSAVGRGTCFKISLPALPG